MDEKSSSNNDSAFKNHYYVLYLARAAPHCKPMRFLSRTGKKFVRKRSDLIKWFIWGLLFCGKIYGSPRCAASSSKYFLSFISMPTFANCRLLVILWLSEVLKQKKKRMKHFLFQNFRDEKLEVFFIMFCFASLRDIFKIHSIVIV